MRIEYDAVGDILYLDLEPPCEDQVNHQLASGVYLHLRASTGEILGLEIQSSKHEAASPSGLETGVDATLAAEGYSSARPEHKNAAVGQ
jgi:uncharacterized protein YuzE